MSARSVAVREGKGLELKGRVSTNQAWLCRELTPGLHPRFTSFSCPLSGSMEPAFQRGDILFLNNQDDPIRVGEIVVFKIKDRDIPIVHRVLEVHQK